LFISRQTAQQADDITSFENDYLFLDNPELKKAKANKQKEVPKRYRELALENANVDR
jgi:hypothetical protein